MTVFELFCPNPPGQLVYDAASGEFSTAEPTWVTDGDDISNANSGNVGIGTAAPDTTLHVLGKIKYQDGTQADKKILTSDADGNASWESLEAASIFGSNGPPAASFACMNEVGSIGVDNAPSRVVVSGNYAYVIDPLSGNLQVIDISTPSIPVQAASLPFGGLPFNMVVKDQFLYMIHGTSGYLRIVDISVPANPVLKGGVFLNSSPSDVAVEGSHAYIVSNQTNRLYVVDLSDPENPTTVGSGLALGNGPVGIDVRNGLAYVIDVDAHDLKVIDVSTPTALNIVGSVGLGAGAQPIDIAVLNDHAYVVDLFLDDLKVIDLSIANAPEVVGSVAVGPLPLAVAVTGNYAFVVDQDHAELKVFDVSQPTAPALEEVLGVGPVANAVAVQGNYAYVSSDGDDELKIIELTCHTGLGYTPLGGISNLVESDPQVGQFVPNAVPRWNGGSLNLGSIFDDGGGLVYIPQSDAQLGIGTSTPQANVEIRTTASSQLRLSLSNTHWAKFRFTDSEGLRIESKHEGVVFRPILLIGSELKFYSGTGTTPERMRITEAGDVGIRTNIPGAELEVNGYTKLGSDAPAIKQKVLTGNFPNAGTNTFIPHGLNADKILSISILIKFAGLHYPPEGLSSHYRSTSTAIGVFSTGTSTLPDGSPMRILITYQE
jgi:hypothetical protein